MPGAGIIKKLDVSKILSEGKDNQNVGLIYFFSGDTIGELIFKTVVCNVGSVEIGNRIGSITDWPICLLEAAAGNIVNSETEPEDLSDALQRFDEYCGCYEISSEDIEKVAEGIGFGAQFDLSMVKPCRDVRIHMQVAAVASSRQVEKNI